MAVLLDQFGKPMREPSFRPGEVIGAPGFSLSGGFVVDDEKAPELRGTRKYKTYSDILANVSIAAAGVRYFLNLISRAKWKFTPSEADASGQYAELAEQCLTDDPETPWSRIVRRAAMYRFYGFSIQEWTTFRRDDGVKTFLDIEPRAQRTIEQWICDMETGRILAAVQVSPHDYSTKILPRGKLLYVVDDALNDGPTGLGLFRHIVKASRALSRMELLEGVGYETDLSGIPVGRIPYSDLNAALKAGRITQAQHASAIEAITDFVTNRVRTPSLGLVLDSSVYRALDGSGTPSSVRQFDVDLIQGTSNSMPQMLMTIDRLNREIARVLGVEALLLGDRSAGSYALSQNKSEQFSLIVDSTNEELAHQVRRDLLGALWKVNGWPDEMKPEVSTEAAQYRDVTEITAALKDMAAAGATIDIRDPAYSEVRGMMGISAPDLDMLEAEGLLPRGDDGVDDDEAMSDDRPKRGGEKKDEKTTGSSRAARTQTRKPRQKVKEAA